MDRSKDDEIAFLRRELARTERDYQELAKRHQMYADVLDEIAKLDHTRVQLGITLAREALKS